MAIGSFWRKWQGPISLPKTYGLAWLAQHGSVLTILFQQIHNKGTLCLVPVNRSLPSKTMGVLVRVAMTENPSYLGKSVTNLANGMSSYEIHT